MEVRSTTFVLTGARPRQPLFDLPHETAQSVGTCMWHHLKSPLPPAAQRSPLTARVMPGAASRRKARWRRGWRNAVTVVTVFVSLPGALEMVRDLAHWVGEGHTIHSEAGDAQDRHGDDTEHGCSGLFHMCQCCGHIQVVQRALVLGIGAASILSEDPPRIPDDGALPGYRAPPFRPPSA